MRVEPKYLSLPLTAELELTNFCNHQCDFCYIADSKTEDYSQRKVNDTIVLACVKKLIDNNIFNITLTGGEPLLNKELTKKVITLLKENGIRIALNTNLTLADDDFIHFLKEHQVVVLTSCPSGNTNSFAKHVGVNDYEVFKEKVKKIAQVGIPFTVNMVITKQNLHDIRMTAKEMKSLGCISFAATPMGLSVKNPQLDLFLTLGEVRQVITDLLWIESNLKMEVEILENLPKCLFPQAILNGKHSFLNRKCQAGRTHIAVSPNGDVRSCAHNPCVYGNILNENLKDIWKNMKIWRSPEYIPKDCKHCSWLHYCNGGCRTNAKAINREWNSKDIWSTKSLTKKTKHNELDVILTPNTMLQMTKHFLIRYEDESSILIYNISENVFFMVNLDFYHFIVDLQKLTKVTIHDLCKMYNTTIDDGNVYDIICFLLKKKMIDIVE